MRITGAGPFHGGRIFRMVRHGLLRVEHPPERAVSLNQFERDILEETNLLCHDAARSRFNDALFQMPITTLRDASPISAAITRADFFPFKDMISCSIPGSSRLDRTFDNNFSILLIFHSSRGMLIFAHSYGSHHFPSVSDHLYIGIIAQAPQENATGVPKFGQCPRYAPSRRSKPSAARF